MRTFPTNLAIVDVETTGGSAAVDRVIEVAVIRVEGMQLVEKYQSLVDPGVSIPPFISRMTGIKDQDVAGAPMFGEVAKDVYPLLKDAVLVAHNARFDYGFLKNEFLRLEQPFNPDLLCTVQFLRRLNPDWRKYNLDEVIRRFDLVCEARHRAMGDCEVLWQLLQVLSQTHSEDLLKPALQLTLKYPTLPKFISETDLKNLPEGSGVYLFYDADDTLLYVGKSVHLKSRIKSHFASDHTNTKEQKIRELVARIETIETAGELGALLLESKLVKERLPLFNRQLRYARKMIVVMSKENEDGYWECSLDERENDLVSDEARDILGVFRSFRQASEYLRELAREYKLCPRLLGVEKGKGECFSSQLGYCQGACAGREKPLKYNLRFAQAFSKTRIKRWPYSGAVAIKESRDDHYVTHVVDQWCYLGGLNNQAELQTGRFDYDVYKILVRMLLRSNSLEVVDLNKQMECG